VGGQRRGGCLGFHVGFCLGVGAMRWVVSGSTASRPPREPKADNATRFLPLRIGGRDAVELAFSFFFGSGQRGRPTFRPDGVSPCTGTKADVPG
jgi:hypothetical protein